MIFSRGTPDGIKPEAWNCA